MKLTDSDKQELYDYITFLIEMTSEYPEETEEVLDGLGWDYEDPSDIFNRKIMVNIRKKLFKGEKRSSYRSYMD